MNFELEFKAVATTKTLRGAIIGNGFVSTTGHIPVYLERSRRLADVEIIAIADVSPTRQELARELLPKAKIYGDYRSMLAVENLDFVDIAAPPYEHAAIAHAALTSPLHVLCEKPLTCRMEDAQALLGHARSVRRVIFPCHNYKHAPIIKAVGAIIRSGRIGKVRSLTMNTYRNTHARGVTEWNSDWRRESRYSGGGVAMDHGIHCFYLAFDWLQSYPTSVTAKMSNHDPGRFDTEDEFAALLTFPTAVAHVHLSWNAGLRKVIYTIEGEKGCITMEDDNVLIETANGAGGGNGNHAAPQQVETKTVPSDWADASHAGWFNGVFEEFQKAIERGDFAGKDAQEAALCIGLIQTAYRSARQRGQELPLIY